jgi:hypothetical protein
MNTGAHPSHAGWNQSGGAHFIIMTNLGNAGVYINTLVNAGSNSGGAFASATLASNTASNAFGATTAAHETEAIAAVTAGRLLKDMGKTIVSSGRTFRKFQTVGGGAGNYASTFGVQGGNAGVPTAANAGYASFYLEVGREGSAGGARLPAPILRYF